MFHLKKILFIFIICLGVAAPLLVLTDSYGLDTAATEAGLKKLDISKKNIPQVAGEIVGVGLSLIGIIFFLLMLYAGVRWMVAMGKTEDVQKAKDTLEAAAIGLVIVLAAYAISRFVFSSLGVGGGGGGGSSPAAGGSAAINCERVVNSLQCIPPCVWRTNLGTASCNKVTVAEPTDCGSFVDQATCEAGANTGKCEWGQCLTPNP